MAAGYFDDGTALDLGAHVWCSPEQVRRVLILEPRDAGAEVLPSGGGELTVHVTGQRLRATLGDAERWMYERLAALATSGTGELGAADLLGNPVTFGEAACVGGQGRVEALHLAQIDYEYLVPEASAAPAWAGAPAAPGTYPATGTAQDYAIAGTALGTHPEELRIEMVRSHPLRPIPRARGARARGPAYGAVMRLRVRSAVVADGVSLGTYLAGLQRAIGPGAQTLTGNGNCYPGCVLESLRPGHVDGRIGRFEAVFVQEPGAGVAADVSTTLAATTTTEAA